MASSNPNTAPTSADQPTKGGSVVIDEGQDLVLVKNGQRYAFRCDTGHETDLLNQLAVMVDRPDNELDWFDAAMLSHEMGQRLLKRIKELGTI